MSEKPKRIITRLARCYAWPVGSNDLHKNLDKALLRVRYPKMPSHIQTEKIDDPVAISTEEAATRRPRPYILAKI
jgi:hypothetical protein